MSEPRIDASIRAAQSTLSDAPQRVLIINSAQAGLGVPAPTGVLFENIANDQTYVSTFGRHSQIVADIAAFKAINSITQLDIIALAPLGTPAVGTITFTGAATAAGSYVVSLGSSQEQSYTVEVELGDTDIEVAAKLFVLVNADFVVGDTPQLVRVTGTTPVIGTVDIAATSSGAVGNRYGVRIVGSVPGLAVVLVGLAGGTGLPVLTGIFDLVGDIRYQTIIAPFEYSPSFIVDFLAPRFNTNNDILDGMGLMTFTDSLANAITVAGGQDNEVLTLFANRLINEDLYKGSQIFEADHVISAQVAATRSLRLTEGANISSIVAAPESLDQTGGAAIAALPYANTPYVGLPPIDRDKTWALAEETQLNTAGATVFLNSKSGKLVLQSRTVSCSKTNSAGVSDTTFKFLNAIDTASAIREFYFSSLKQRYAQTRLTEGDVEPNRAMTNAQGISAFCSLLYQRLGGADFVLVQAGAESVKFFKKNLKVNIVDLSLGHVSVSMRVLLVGQLRTIDLPIEVSFTTV